LKADQINEMLDQYYQERGWDVSRGVPTAETLNNLGLASFSAQQ
jgi:aldehyde:ferredoxin oxidoreductase